MTNTLIRVGSSYVIPGTPYQPARPAYTSYETYTITYTQPPGGTIGNLPPGWVYKNVPIPQPDGTTRYERQLVWTGSSQGGGTGTSSSFVTYSAGGGATITTTRTEAVFHPAQAEVVGTRPQLVAKPPVGWTSFARSAAFMRAGTAEFSVKFESLAAAVGLSAAASATVGYSHITHGLLFNNGTVQNLRTGASYGAFATSDVFAVRLKDGTITFLKNGSSVATEASTFTPVPLYLSAALYAPQDAIDEPSLLEALGSHGALTLSRVAARGYEDTYADGRVVIKKAVVAGSVGSRGALTLRRVQAFGSEAEVYAQGLLELPSLTVAAYGGSLAVELDNRGEIGLPSLVVAGLILTGETGGGALALRPVRALGSDRPYAEGRLTLKSAGAFGYDEPASEAFLLEIFQAQPTFDSVTELVAVMYAGSVVAATFTVTTVLEALMRDVAVGTVSLSTTSLINALMYSFVSVGDTTSVPTTDGDTWAVNLRTNGSTSYTGFGFNSFARLGTTYLGANSDGVYELDGDTDAGAPIRASFSLGEQDGGSAFKKTWEQCYFGMSAAGNLFLKIIAEGRTYTYRTRDFSSEMQQQRVTLGKGLRTNYVTLEVYNEDGKDFEIDTVQFIVADLSRKI